jgi:hypothetical protein
MPMAPAAVIAMTWEIIVFCTFYLFARAIQGTFEFAPLVGAQIAVPLEAILHARYAPLTAHESLGFTA